MLKFVKNPELGVRNIYFDTKICITKEDFDSLVEGEEITLMNWGNCFVDKNNKTFKLHLEGDFKKTEKKILWLSHNKNVKVLITSYTGLFDPPNQKYYIGDFDINKLKTNDYVQFMKMNYYMYIKQDNINNIFEFIDIS